VNPSKLQVALQLDICQRCHIQGNAVLGEGKSFFDFRPGMHLSEVMNVFMPAFKGDDNSHIMASHAERLKMSKCFINTVSKAEDNSKNKLKPYQDAMTCVTCHNPHVSVRVTGEHVFNDACKNCHSENKSLTNLKANSTCTEKLSVRLANGDNCVACHMPKNNTIDIPHVTVTDHYIRKPVDRKAAAKIREFIGLACINNKEVNGSTLAEAYLSYYEKFSSNPSSLDSAKKYLSDLTESDIKSNFKNLVRWAFLSDKNDEVIRYAENVPDALKLLKNKSYNNDDAWTSYRIAESYRSGGNNLKSLEYFENAVDLEPYNLEFRNKLGSLQMDSGKIEDARKNFQFILSENPEFISAWINLGYLCLTSDHDIQKADAYYDKALKLDPDNEQALLNKSGILLYRGEKIKSKKMLEHLLAIYPDNLKAKEIFNSLK
jgi:tetratricopeptide (TPR) repeat protein